MENTFSRCVFLTPRALLRSQLGQISVDKSNTGRAWLCLWKPFEKWVAILCFTWVCSFDPFVNRIQCCTQANRFFEILCVLCPTFCDVELWGRKGIRILSFYNLLSKRFFFHLFLLCKLFSSGVTRTGDSFKENCELWKRRRCEWIKTVYKRYFFS